jgi:hypothetical protein
VSLVLSLHLGFSQESDVLRAEIYSKISDSRCPTMTLEKCNCSEAQAMKAYIDAFLEVGSSREDIFYKVAKKYSVKVIRDESIRLSVEQRLIKESGGKYSKITLVPEVVNFGVKSRKDGEINSLVKLYNQGNSDLIITNLRVSCDCTTVSLKTDKISSPAFGMAGASSGWQAIIEPGNFGELEVVLDLSHKSMAAGKQIREIFIASNDIFNPQAGLRVEVEVQE